MSEGKSRLQEGPPIWVESLMTPEEHRQAHKDHPTTVKKSTPIAYDPSYHRGGTWREGMGGGLTPEEIAINNKNIDNLRKLLTTKKFQRLPEYGPHNEARP